MKTHAILLAVALAGPVSRPATAQDKPAGQAIVPAQFDRHFLDSAEYFIAVGEMSGAYQNVALARMVIPPSSTSRGDAQFLVLGGGGRSRSTYGFTTGQRVWTRHYWRTRAATTEDIAPGKVVFCLDTRDNGVYRAPGDRAEALNVSWFMTTITDVSDLFRQEIRAGDYRLNIDCLRVSF